MEPRNNSSRHFPSQFTVGRGGGSFRSHRQRNASWPHRMLNDVDEAAYRYDDRQRFTNNRGRGRQRQDNSQQQQQNSRTPRRNQANSASAIHQQRQTGSDSSQVTSDIEGFYFDPLRNRYFRILQDQYSSGPFLLTAQSINLRNAEARRLQQMQQRNVNGQHQRNTEDGQGGGPKEKIVKKKKLASNVCDLNYGMQLGSASKESIRRVLFETRLKHAQPTPTTVLNVLDDQPDVQLQHCQFIDTCSEGKTLLGCWSSRYPPWGSRIMCLNVVYKAADADERHYGLHVEQTDNFICHLDRNVVDVCQAKMDSSVTCVLYVTLPNVDRGSRVFLQPLPELSNICDVEFLDSPIYNAHWGMAECAWSCGWEPRNMRVSVGLERCGMIVDVVSETDFKIFSRHKNVLNQKFSKDGNLLYMGLRGSDIICCDLRRHCHHTVHSFPQTSTCWITVLNDDNFLLASNYYGDINLWDLRQRRVVQELKGLKNTHTKVPVVVSEDETLAFAVGEDGTTHAWSLRNGETLCTIPAPYPVVDRECIPKLCYSNNWGGLSGNAAVVLAVKDKLHFYELMN